MYTDTDTAHLYSRGGVESGRQAGAERRLRVNFEQINKQAETELKLDCDLETEQRILVRTAEVACLVGDAG